MILRVRDENGNFIPINAIKGDRGKSAYEQAVEGGYKGTEEEFVALLNGLLNPVNVVVEDEDHCSDYNNPHKVTAEQARALSIDGTNVMEAPLQLLYNAKITGNRDAVLASCLIDAINDSGEVCRLVVEKTHDGKSNIFVQSIDGNGVSTSKIYGEHNKPTGSYSGRSGQGEQKIQIGGMGNVLLITSSSGDLTFVTATGARSLWSNSDYFNASPASTANFTNGVLTVKDGTIGISVDGVTYYYQVL